MTKKKIDTMTMNQLPRLNAVGAGKLGRTLTKALVDAQLISMGQVCNRTNASAREVVQFLGEGSAVAGFDELVAADVWLLTVPDDDISSVCDQLSRLGVFQPGAVVIHCSGALTSSALSSAKACGCLVGSWHPIYSFSSLHEMKPFWKNMLFSFEGDLKALQLCTMWLDTLGARIFSISEEQKALYHAGLVMAANGSVGLADSAIELFRLAGVDESVAYQSVMQVMESALSAMRQAQSTACALTGPVARRDIETVSEHMDVLSQQCSLIHYDLYCLLSNYLSLLTSRE